MRKNVSLCHQLPLGLTSTLNALVLPCSKCRFLCCVISCFSFTTHKLDFFAPWKFIHMPPATSQKILSFEFAGRIQDTNCGIEAIQYLNLRLSIRNTLDHLICNHFSRKVLKSGSRKVVREIWFKKSGSRKMVDQKKRWFYTINPHFSRLEKSG